jgi:predicted membrane protein
VRRAYSCFSDPDGGNTFVKNQYMHTREHRLRNRFSKRRENIIGGIILLGIGGILLARQVGVDLPPWLFTWPMIPIIVGVFVGIKTHFKDFGWLLLIGVGTFFLVDKMPNVAIREYILPIIVISAGVIVLLGGIFRKPRRMLSIDDSSQPQGDKLVPAYSGATAENIMEVVSIFGSAKRVVLSKNFKGGEIVSIFGSSEINLTNADFTGTLVLEVVQIFGGTKLIIPPHWEVQSQTATIFGGIEDKRSIQPGGDTPKILVIDGATIFGGVTISSY